MLTTHFRSNMDKKDGPRRYFEHDCDHSMDTSGAFLDGVGGSLQVMELH